MVRDKSGAIQVLRWQRIVLEVAGDLIRFIVFVTVLGWSELGVNVVLVLGLSNSEQGVNVVFIPVVVVMMIVGIFMRSLNGLNLDDIHWIICGVRFRVAT